MRCPHCGGVVALVAADTDLPLADVTEPTPTRDLTGPRRYVADVTEPTMLALTEAEVRHILNSRAMVALSGREMEVLRLIARGCVNKEIARTLKISDQTVKNHITSILRKMAVNDRTQATVLALRRGMITFDETA
jgi:DNA-binding NarL/FixJ family response regulator